MGSWCQGRRSGRTGSGFEEAGVIPVPPPPSIGLEVSQLLAGGGNIRESLIERYSITL